MSKKFIFSAAEDEILIEEIQNNKVIYDSSDKNHKDKIMKDSLWSEIGIKLNRNIDDCKKRWKNMRDTYMRQKKKLPTGSATSDKKKWPLMDYLSFLDTVEYERQTCTNVETQETTTEQNIMSNDLFRDEEDIVDVENESCNSETEVLNLPAISFGGKRLRSKDDKLSAILAKRSKERNEMLSNIQAQNNLLASLDQKEDEVDVFFKSIAMTVKKLPSRAINEAKLRILTMVNEIEEKYVVPDHTKTIQPNYVLPLNSNNMAQWLSPANSYTTAASSSSSGYMQYNNDSNSMPQCPSPANSSNTAASSSSCGFIQYNRDEYN